MASQKWEVEALMATHAQAARISAWLRTLASQDVQELGEILDGCSRQIRWGLASDWVQDHGGKSGWAWLLSARPSKV